MFIPQELESLNLEEQGQFQNLEELTLLAEELGVVFWDNIGGFLIFFAIHMFLGIVLIFAPFAASLEKQNPIQALHFSIANALPNFFNILFTYLILVLAIAIIAYLTNPFRDSRPYNTCDFLFYRLFCVHTRLESYSLRHVLST